MDPRRTVGTGRRQESAGTECGERGVTEMFRVSLLLQQLGHGSNKGRIDKNECSAVGIDQAPWTTGADADILVMFCVLWSPPRPAPLPLLLGRHICERIPLHSRAAMCVY